LPIKAEELLHMSREKEYRPGKNEGDDQPPLEIGQHFMMAFSCMALYSVALIGMAGMSHLGLIFLGFILKRIPFSLHFPFLVERFLFDFYHRLLIRGLMMRMGWQSDHSYKYY